MRFDHTHRWWGGLTIAAVVACLAWYGREAWVLHHQPRGGSVCGLVFGSLAFSTMFFAGALALRKFFRSWKLVATRYWLRGHLWLGAASLPFALMHCGNHFGGPLTSMLMGLTYFVVISGLIGAVCQHFLPR